jgi:hypothetical protein
MTVTQGFDPWYQLATNLGRRPDAEIITALLTLPKHSRILVCLADIDRLACQGIAQITGTAAGIVGSSLHQARCQLGALAVAGSRALIRGRARSLCLLVSLHAAWLASGTARLPFEAGTVRPTPPQLPLATDTALGLALGPGPGCHPFPENSKELA